MNLEVPVQTKLITITAVAACAKAELIGQIALRNIAYEYSDIDSTHIMHGRSTATLAER